MIHTNYLELYYCTDTHIHDDILVN